MLRKVRCKLNKDGLNEVRTVCTLCPSELESGEPHHHLIALRFVLILGNPRTKGYEEGLARSRAEGTATERWNRASPLSFFLTFSSDS